MAFEQTWRWFGPKDPITLEDIKQTGATGIVTALHQIPIGEVWPLEAIRERQAMIEAAGLVWSVVESVPVHESIKKRRGDFQAHIDHYIQTLRRLGQCGIHTVCYNFMPVLDWSRTDLNVVFNDGSVTSKFESRVFAAFDLFILKRNDAEKDYTPDQIARAEEYFKSLDENRKKKLTDTILLGFPGSLEAYTVDGFRAAIEEYRIIGKKELRENLAAFIREIVPVAEEMHIFLVIHPDDPPWPLLGLPRIVSSREDLKFIVDAVDSPANGITLCTGSLGVGIKNDLVEITREFANRINFVHLRNVIRNADGDFMEEHHLDGEIDLYEIMKILLLEQKRRITGGRIDFRMPMRPDHGHLMKSEQNKEGIYPGYSLLGRLRGLSELRGMEMGIRRSLGL